MPIFICSLARSSCRFNCNFKCCYVSMRYVYVSNCNDIPRTHSHTDRRWNVIWCIERNCVHLICVCFRVCRFKSQLHSRLLRVNVVDVNERHLMIISLVECRKCYYRLSHTHTHARTHFTWTPSLSYIVWVSQVLVAIFPYLFVFQFVFILCSFFRWSAEKLCIQTK